MTITVSNTANTDTMYYWLNRTNELADAMSNFVITTNSNNTVGNAFVQGTFGATTLVTTTLRGGNVSTSNTLVISSNVSVGNSTVNTVINSTSISIATITGVNTISVGNSTVNTTVNSTSLTTTGLLANTFSLGNSTVNSVANSTTFNISSSIVVGNSTVNSVANSTTFTTTGLLANTISLGNSTVNSTVNSTSLSISGIVSNTILVGNSTVNTVINSSSVSVLSIVANGTVGTANQVLTSNGTTSYWANAIPAVVGTNTEIQFNDSGKANGLSTFVFDKSTTTVSVGNSTVNTVINSSSVSVLSIVANGTIGSANQVLTSNGTTTYWANAAATVVGTNTEIQFNDSGEANGLSSFTFNKSTTTVSVGNSTVNTTISPSLINATGSVKLAAPFFEGSINVASDYTISSGYNAMSPGPISINSGVTVTVPSGSVWTVV